MGHASLPAPTPCSTGGSCPTYEIKPASNDRNSNGTNSNDANIIARQS
jgi:hypothetical protein